MGFLRHSNSISVISWWCYDAWDEERKVDPALLPIMGIFNLPHHLGMIWEEVVFDDALIYTGGKWIAAQLNVMAVTGFVHLSPGFPTEHSPYFRVPNKLRILLWQRAELSAEFSFVCRVYSLSITVSESNITTPTFTGNSARCESLNSYWLLEFYILATSKIISG